MRIALLTYGTRGDVQPFVALALGLRQAGHTVRLAVPERLAGLAEARGFECVPLAGDPARLSQLLADQAGKGPLSTMRAMIDFIYPLAGQVMAGLRAACREAELIGHTFLTTSGGHALAREQGVPDFSALFFPIFAPTGDFPAIAFPAPPWGRGYNRLTHHLATALFWQGGHLGYEWVRRTNPIIPQRLDWPFKPSARGVTPQLFAFSPLAVPRPVDWGPHRHITGYWPLLDTTAWEPPVALARFLAAGPPPIAVDFGSLVSRDAARVQRAVLEAIRERRLRAVILTGWAGWPAAELPLPPEMLLLESAPHDWLFPRLAAVVHHGGAGTTAAVLRAGVPQVVVPFSADQPFWAQRMAALGVAPAPLPAAQLTASRLSQALRVALDDPGRRQEAAEVARQLQAEDGVANAVTLIERHADQFRGRGLMRG